ncbi:MAG: hypothetical protein KAG56_09350, partial [Sulfurovaceae bacterium]|nr:hypothetical protein [Sulfurovaceae bacterium]
SIFFRSFQNLRKTGEFRMMNGERLLILLGLGSDLGFFRSFQYITLFSTTTISIFLKTNLCSRRNNMNNSYDTASVSTLINSKILNRIISNFCCIESDELLPHPVANRSNPTKIRFFKLSP